MTMQISLWLQIVAVDMCCLTSFFEDNCLPLLETRNVATTVKDDDGSTNLVFATSKVLHYIYQCG